MVFKYCPECGKLFPAYPDHALHNEYGDDVCSPHCSTAAWKREQARIKEAFEEEERSYEAYKEKQRKKYGDGVIRNRTAVQICDRDGNVIQRFRSISEASRMTGWSKSTIHQACNGVLWVKMEYTFRYDDPLLRKSPKPPKKRDRSHRFKPILQLTEDGEIVARYASGKEAAEAVGCCPSSIVNCCAGRLRKLKGFVFVREEDFVKERNGHAEV